MDHYESSGESKKFSIRYLTDDQYFDKEKGPIFFYTGNEGDIYDFYKNSGFMTTTLAKEHGAMVLFGEHRFFGESYPVDKKEAFKPEWNKYLTLE